MGGEMRFSRKYEQLHQIEDGMEGIWWLLEACLSFDKIWYKTKKLQLHPLDHYWIYFHHHILCLLLPFSANSFTPTCPPSIPLHSSTESSTSTVPIEIWERKIKRIGPTKIDCGYTVHNQYFSLQETRERRWGERERGKWLNTTLNKGYDKRLTLFHFLYIQKGGDIHVLQLSV